MRKPAILSLLLLAAVIVTAQTTAQSQRVPRKVPGAAKPECARDALCFSDEVHDGNEVRHGLTADLDFVVRLPGGIDVVPKPGATGCDLSLWVANPPLMAHHDTEIDAAYDWKAEDEVQHSPRAFRFVTNCTDYQTLFDLSQTDAEKYFAKLDSLAKGQGRLWITDSRVRHSHGIAENGTVEWIQFSVEIKLPVTK